MIEKLNPFKKKNDKEIPIAPPPPTKKDSKDIEIETELDDVPLPPSNKKETVPTEISEPQKIKKEIEKKPEEYYQPKTIDPDYIEMRAYIKYNLYYGQSPKAIRKTLLKAGWDKTNIDKAFSEITNQKTNKDMLTKY